LLSQSKHSVNLFHLHNNTQIVRMSVCLSATVSQTGSEEWRAERTDQTMHRPRSAARAGRAFSSQSTASTQ